MKAPQMQWETEHSRNCKCNTRSAHNWNAFKFHAKEGTSYIHQVTKAYATAYYGRQFTWTYFTTIQILSPFAKPDVKYYHP